MQVRKYQEKDHAALIDLWKTAFPNSASHNEPSKMIIDKLAVDDLLFVAEKAEELIGACIAGYDGHRGWLYAVAVAKHHRRQGVGAAIVKYAMQALKERGCTKVNLQIRETNTAVAAFYKTLGFKVEERLSMGAFID